MGHEREEGVKPEAVPEPSLLEGCPEFSKKAEEACPENQPSLLSRMSPAKTHVHVRMFRATKQKN